jgi:hypothetical protein
MLTRDISLEDCILDLVDNAIDGAWSQSGEKPDELKSGTGLDGREVKILLSESKFSISDNCGGISFDDAVDYAFTFGRDDEQTDAGFTVGVYGIGMKRAVFKIGKSIRIHSTYEEAGSLKAFTVPIEIDTWLREKREPWDFEIDEAQPDVTPGVRIEITELYDEVRKQFQDAKYIRALRTQLSRDYLLPLMRGLEISLNGDVVESREPVLQESSAFKPMRTSYLDDGVKVEIFAGMWRSPPNDTEPETSGRLDNASGWYILCNGRAVLSADRTSVTGWGDALPRWHSQYGGFHGYVLFSSKSPELLPMTTTKRSVNTSSGVYRRALARIEEPTRAWINYTNSRKKDLDGVKDIEESTKSRPISAIEENSQVLLPAVKASKQERVANVNYAVDVDRLKDLAASLGDRSMTYREVGIRSFDYAYGELVEDEA